MTVFQITMPGVVPREKYLEMDWRAADKVATWKVFKCHMKVIFMADQDPEERQYALILVAGGDKAFNHWNNLEDTMENVKDSEQVWDTFEKSLEQSTSFWHFRDAYLRDFRQDPTESTADLDLCIKETVKGCQWKKGTEEEQMIDLLYHATQSTMRYVSTFKSQNQPHLSMRWSLKRQRLMSMMFLSTKTIRLLTEEPTVRLLTISPC